MIRIDWGHLSQLKDHQLVYQLAKYHAERQQNTWNKLCLVYPIIDVLLASIMIDNVLAIINIPLNYAVVIVHQPRLEHL